MTIPVPTPTSPAADAAVHIRNMAEAIDTKLSAGRLVAATFEVEMVATATDGFITTAPLTTLPSNITGVVAGPVALVRDASSDHSYVPLLTWINTYDTRVRCRCINAPNHTYNAGKRQKMCGIAWAPPAAGMAEITPMANPGDLFPPGVTTKAKIRYPGTTDEQFETAQHIHNLADDVGKAIGGPVGVNLITWREDAVQLNASGYAERTITGLSLIKGAVLMAWDSGNFVRKSRNIQWIPPSHPDDGGPKAGTTLRFRSYTPTQAYPAPNQTPLWDANGRHGIMAFIWGDL